MGNSKLVCLPKLRYFSFRGTWFNELPPLSQMLYRFRDFHPSVQRERKEEDYILKCRLGSNGRVCKLYITTMNVGIEYSSRIQRYLCNEKKNQNSLVACSKGALHLNNKEKNAVSISTVSLLSRMIHWICKLQGYVATVLVSIPVRKNGE